MQFSHVVHKEHDMKSLLLNWKSEYMSSSISNNRASGNHCKSIDAREALPTGSGKPKTTNYEEKSSSH